MAGRGVLLPRCAGAGVGGALSELMGTLLLVLVTMMMIAENLHPTGRIGVEAMRCSLYDPAPGLNELAYPINNRYNEKRTYFGAPAICDSLSHDTFFFVPENGTDKEDVENQAFRSALGVGVLSKECRVAATKVLCASAFRKCETFHLSSSLPNFFVFPLPRPPCRSLCDEMHRACKDAGIELPDCEHKTDGMQDFPKRKATFVIDGVGSFQVPCQDYSNLNVSAKELEPVVCPWPLDLRRNGNPPCQPVCPHFNVYTEDEYDTFLNLRFGLSIFSLCVSCWTFLTLITIREKRKFPISLSIILVGVHIIWMITSVVSSSMRVRNVVCNGRFDFATQYSPVMCGIEGPIMVWSILMMTFLWVTLGIQLWCYVVLEKTNKELLGLWLPVYAICFGVPTVNVIIAYAAQKFKLQGIFPHCWMEANWWDFPLLFIPVTICTVVLVLAILWTFIKLFNVKRRFMSAWKIIYKHSNILTFTLGFTIVEFFFIALRYWEFEWESTFLDLLTETVECNAKRGLNDCQIPDKAVFPIRLLYSYDVFLYGGTGIIVFLAFGCSWQYVLHWKNLFMVLRSGEFRRIGNLSIADTTNASSATTRSSKSKSSKRSERESSPNLNSTSSST